MKDTSPKINALLFQAMMRKTPGERLIMGMSMTATARALVGSGIPADLGEQERRKAFYERFYGETYPL